MIRRIALVGLLLASNTAFAGGMGVATAPSARSICTQPTHAASLRGGLSFVVGRSIPMLYLAWSTKYGQPREPGEITF